MLCGYSFAQEDGPRGNLISASPTAMHWGYFRLKSTLGFKSPEDTDSSTQMSRILRVGVEMNDPTSPEVPLPKGVLWMHGEQQGCLAGILSHGVKAQKRWMAAAGPQKQKLFLKYDTPLFIFSVADRDHTNPCLPSLPAAPSRNSPGSPA